MADNRILKITTIILSILLIGSSAYLYVSLEEIKQKDASIAAMSGQVASQKQEISQLQANISNLQGNLSMTEALLNNETQKSQDLEAEIINLTLINKSDYWALAVDENDVGHLIPIEVIIKEGKGNLFLNVANVLVDETMQSSAQTAIQVAREVTRTSLAGKDVLINIEAPLEENLVISGGSAGGAITIAAIAAMLGKTPRSDVLMTGTINEDYTIGKVGAARAKGFAAKENGAKLFLVPLGQKAEVGGIGIDVIEVGTIQEAMKYAI